MIEPDWSTAPRWAQWFAIDGNGEAWWYEIEPYVRTRDNMWGMKFSYNEGWQCEPTETYLEAIWDWQNSLKKRPAEGGENDRT